MDYVLWIRGRAYYNRRVPELLRNLDRRECVRVSLKTDSKKEARRNAAMFNEQLEAYWQDLIIQNKMHDAGRFDALVDLARKMGFSYKPLSEVLMLPGPELVERVMLAAKETTTPKQVEAVLGGLDEPVTPEVTLKDALDLYWTLINDKIMGKSEFQIRKWKNPRRKAVENFIELRGNKNAKDVTRDDTIALRDWWITRIKTEKRNADSANKNMLHLRAVLETVSDHLKLGLDIDYLFKKTLLKTKRRKTRKPFSAEQIVAILHSEKLEGMHLEAKNFFFAMADTGARPSELVALEQEDIILDVPIPHIIIRSHEDAELKTEQSHRIIPLVGYALEALQRMPDGFKHYKHKSDILTTAVNKFLRYNKLVPLKGYTCYSLRHSFQDRLLHAKAPHRVQTDLMGHVYDPSRDYGEGSNLKLKKEYMDMTCLKNWPIH